MSPLMRMWWVQAGGSSKGHRAHTRLMLRKFYKAGRVKSHHFIYIHAKSGLEILLELICTGMPSREDTRIASRMPASFTHRAPL